MRIHQPQFAILFPDVAIANINVVIANRLYLRSKQNQASIVSISDEVLASGLAILGYDFSAAVSFCRRIMPAGRSCHQAL